MNKDPAQCFDAAGVPSTWADLCPFSIPHRMDVGGIRKAPARDAQCDMAGSGEPTWNTVPMQNAQNRSSEAVNTCLLMVQARVLSPVGSEIQEISLACSSKKND